MKNDEWVLRNALDRLWIRKIDHHEETALERLDSVMKSLLSSKIWGQFRKLWERFRNRQNSQQADGDVYHRSEGSTSAETNRQELLTISNDQPV